MSTTGFVASKLAGSKAEGAVGTVKNDTLREVGRRLKPNTHIKKHRAWGAALKIKSIAFV
jgi:hypothetical protein